LNLPETEECKGIIGEFALSLEDSVNWGILGKCLSDSTAEDKLIDVGFRLRWIEPISPGGEWSEAYVLCPIDQEVPSTFEKWWFLEANRCSVIGELPERNQQFLEAEFDAIGCTLRCKINGVQTGSILEFETADGSLSMGFGYISDPDVGVSDFYYIPFSLLLVLFISKLIVGRFGSLFRRGRVSREAGGLEKNEALENTIDSQVDRDRTDRLREIRETMKDEIKESEGGESSGDDAPMEKGM